MGNAYPHAACEAVLHPADVIATTVQIPAVARPRFAAAVHSALEPLVLSDLAALAVATLLLLIAAGLLRRRLGTP
ncbi:hypothetical protein G6F50_013284 [Rhizopus delemar]|uniref:Uncharacterized protein n=1 Tax=Rhizopus delemar TaxID=936053 RepID=A0A9P6YJU4_9FUNG|nr:hypothetical protein G6F50_013284 [Rhizopus delemar]